MDIVTIAGTGRHGASWRSGVVAALFGVVDACKPQGPSMPGMQVTQGPRVRQLDLRNLPTFDPQRASAPSRWGP